MNAAQRTDVRDLLEMAELDQQNSIESLRSAKDSCSKILLSLERRLRALRSDESRILNRMYPLLSLAELQDKKAGTYSTIDDINAYDPLEVERFDPQERITFFYSELRKSIEDLNNNLKEKQSEINEVLAEIILVKRKQKSIDDALSSSTAPTQADLETDRIIRRQGSEILLLWDLHLQYKSYSSKTNDTEGYSSDVKITSLLNVIKNQFSVLAENQPNLKLDLSNPGSDTNDKELSRALEVLKKTSSQPINKVVQAVTKSVSSLTKYINDPLNIGITRKPADTPPEESNSRVSQTKSISKFMKLTQDVANWTAGFDLSSLLDSNQRVFLTKISNLNGGAPLCDPPPPTQEDKNNAQQDSQTQQIDTQASDDAQANIQKQVSTQTPGPPEGITGLMQSLFRSSNTSTLTIRPGSSSYLTILSSVDISTTVADNNVMFVGMGKGSSLELSGQSALLEAQKLFIQAKGGSAIRTGIITSTQTGNIFISYAYVI